MLASVAALGGCASRAVPFDSLDQAQVTIYKLQPPQAVPQPTGATAGGNPWLQMLPPDLQQAGQALLQQWQQMGVPIPALPGLTPTPTPAPVAPQMQMLRGQWQVSDQRPIMDAQTREQLLDLFGNAENFSNQQAGCFNAGMAVQFVAPDRPEAVDVVISLSCNTVNGFGFAWPHPAYGLAPRANQTLSSLYQSLFGPIPPGA